MKTDSIKVKSYLKNHTSLLFIFIALVVSLINYLIYPLFIKNQLSLVEIPIATTKIEGTSLIKDNMITTISINKNLLPDNIVTNVNDIVGKYVRNEYCIPDKSFFYKESISDIATTSKSSLMDHEVSFTIKFDNQYNKDSIIIPGQLVNLYYFDEISLNGEKKIVIGEIKPNVRVLSIIHDNEYDYLNVAILEDEVEYFLIAQERGYIIPLLFSSNDSEVFDIDATRSYLLEKGVIFNK